MEQKFDFMWLQTFLKMSRLSFCEDLFVLTVLVAAIVISFYWTNPRSIKDLLSIWCKNHTSDKNLIDVF